MNKWIAISVLALTASSGCAVRVVRPTRDVPPPPPPVVVTRPAPSPRPPPPPVDRRMGYDEAVSRAIQFARSRGFSSSVQNAHLTGNDLWKVKLAIARGGSRGQMHVELDAWNRNVVRSQEKIRYRDRDDDRDHGRGNGHGYEHRATSVRD